MTTAEIKKSVDSVLKERMTSPFWGALIASWVAWNWKFVYFTIFTTSESISSPKYEYIENNFETGLMNFLLIPLGLTAVLIFIVPFLSGGAFWINLLFSKWRIEKKIEIEKKIPLTIDESIKLRSELLSLDHKFKELTKDKDERIIELDRENKKLEAEKSNLENELQKKEEAVTQLSEELDQRVSRYDISKVFKGEWTYHVSNKDKRIFQIERMNRFFFLDSDNRELFKSYVLDRTGKSHLKLLLQPEPFDKNKDYEMIIIEINRQKGNVYKGYEWKMKKTVDSIMTTFSDVTLYE